MMTTAAQYADRILEACQLANTNRLELELEDAWNCCRTHVPSSGLEWEQQELLETIVENLRGVSGAPGICPPARLGAEFALLRHLRGHVLQTS